MTRYNARTTKSRLESVTRLDEMHNHSNDIDELLRLQLKSLIIGRIISDKFITATVRMTKRLADELRDSHRSMKRAVFGNSYRAKMISEWFRRKTGAIDT